MNGLSRSRGATLVELVVVLAISSVVVALVISAMIDLDRSRRPRELAAQIQGEGRSGLSMVERELRVASLGAPTGVVWVDRSGARVSRPMVQIYDDLPGGGALRAKAGTDALLIVRAETGVFAATVGEHLSSTADVAVTDSSLFSAGDRVLIGEYGDASWDAVGEVRVGALDLTSATNVFPGRQSTLLHAGAFVRRARSTLYYVDADDRVMRATLAKPWAPRSAAEIVDLTIVAQGIENMQVGCETESGSGTFAFGGCPAEAGAGGEIASDAAWALGTFVGSDGPRLTAENVGTLRSLTLDLAVRSTNPLPAESHGDPKVSLDGKQPPVGGGKPDDAEYMRRTYRVGIGVRNTSLEVL